MLNQAKPALARGPNKGRTFVLLLPSSKPPPWTRIAAGKGPGPSGTCRSSRSGLPPGFPYSTSFLSMSAADKNGAATAKRSTNFRMEGNCISPGQYVFLASVERPLGMDKPPAQSTKEVEAGDQE